MTFQAIPVQEAQRLYRQEAQHMEALARVVRRPSPGGISPRRTARRLTPILEKQAEQAQTDIIWIAR